MNKNEQENPNKYSAEKFLQIMEELREKENELKELKSKIPFELLKNEKLMTVIFNSNDQKVLYSIICKNTDTFSRLENELFKVEEYKEYKEAENYFILKGNYPKKYYF